MDRIGHPMDRIATPTKKKDEEEEEEEEEEGDDGGWSRRWVRWCRSAGISRRCHCCTIKNSFQFAHYMRLVKNRSIDPLSIAFFKFFLGDFFGILGFFWKMGRSVEDEEETKDAGIVAAAAATEGGGGGGEEARLLRITSIRREEEVADEEFVENLKRQNDDDDDSSRSNIISTSTTSSRCSSPREKEKKEESCRLWSKVKYQLVKFEALPEYLRDNEYIRGHYRLNWPLGPTLLSLFSFHNETLNIWT